MTSSPTPPNGVNYRLARLEEDIGRIDRRLESVSDTMSRRGETFAEVRALVNAAVAASERCNKNVEELDRKQDEREERKRIERRSDRRFLVATTVSAAGIVIAALAFLASVL